MEAVKQVYKELAESRSAQEHENHWVDRSGQRHLISWSSTVVTEAQDATRHLVWVGVDVTEARLAEKALQQTEILRHSQEQLRTLTAGLVEAQEEERRRVSQELHDDISQRLAALAIQVEVLHQAHGISPEELHGKLGELQKQMEVLSEDLRRTARNLHPFMLTHLGLEPALRSYCEEFAKLRKIQGAVHGACPARDNPVRGGPVRLSRGPGGAGERRQTCRGEARRGIDLRQ